MPLNHPVNLAYEAATADLNDVNMIDPFHLEAYGDTTVNYNRDVEVFPVLMAIFEKILGHCPYKSPTDMGVNMVGNCIVDDEVVRFASRQEIIRRYYVAMCEQKQGKGSDETVHKLELLMKKAGADPGGTEGGRPCPAAGGADRRACRGHGTARRHHRHRQDLRPSGRVLGAAAERAEKAGGYAGQPAPDFPGECLTPSST